MENGEANGSSCFFKERLMKQSDSPTPNRNDPRKPTRAAVKRKKSTCGQKSSNTDDQPPTKACRGSKERIHGGTNSK